LLFNELEPLGDEISLSFSLQLFVEFVSVILAISWHADDVVADSAGVGIGHLEDEASIDGCFFFLSIISTLEFDIFFLLFEYKLDSNEPVEDIGTVFPINNIILIS